jgi:hypothetical protein
MTSKEIENFKEEVRIEIREEVKANFGLVRWILATLITLFLAFVGGGLYNIIRMNEYVTKEEFRDKNTEISIREDAREEKLKTDLTNTYSLQLQLVAVQQKQMKAILIEKNRKKYELAKEEEERINIEITRLTYDLTTRGSK